MPNWWDLYWTLKQINDFICLCLWLFKYSNIYCIMKGTMNVFIYWNNYCNQLLITTPQIHISLNKILQYFAVHLKLKRGFILIRASPCLSMHPITAQNSRERSGSWGMAEPSLCYYGINLNIITKANKQWFIKILSLMC